MHTGHVPGPDHVHHRSGRQDFDSLPLNHPGAFLVPFWCPGPPPTFPLQEGHQIAVPLVEHYAIGDRTEGGGEGWLQLLARFSLDWDKVELAPWWTPPQFKGLSGASPG